MKSSKEIFLNLTLPSKKWDHYFDIYDRYLTRYIGKNANILEIIEITKKFIAFFFIYFFFISLLFLLVPLQMIYQSTYVS